MYTADNLSPTLTLSNSPPKNLSDSPLKNVITTTPSRQSENSTIFDETLKRKLPQKRLHQILKHYDENDESDDDEFDNLDDDEQLFGPNFVGNDSVSAQTLKSI